MKLGRCGLLRESFPKKLDWRRRFRNRRRSMSVNLVFADESPAGCAGRRAFLRERGFPGHTSPLQCGETAGVALTEQCGPGGWPGPRLFWTSCHGSSRIHTDKAKRIHQGCNHKWHLIIRFLFSYTGQARMRPEKFSLFPVFRRHRWTSTSAPRLISRSNFEANFLSRS